MLKKLLSIWVVLGWALAVNAQEFNCNVTILHDKVTGVDPQVFAAMQKGIADFINSYKWTNDVYGNTEKIDLKILLNITGNNVNGDVDAYGANMSIQATRPVFNSAYASPLINYVDKYVSFHFSQYAPLHFDENNVAGTDALTSNLTAVMAYYCYIVLALDYDSYSLDGGTQYLKKAQNVVTNAPEGKGISGWKAVENNVNRYWLVDQMLNTRFEDVRKFWYTMHREGLDSLAAKPVESRDRILTNIKKLYTVNRENPSSIYIQFFFNAKSDEILHLLGQASKPERMQYITMLSALDVPNAAKYNGLR